jgi:putative ABC transport system permease protein
MLAKRPSFTIIAVITLALGIGANTAIFSVVNAVLLRALPYHNSNRLVILWSTDSGGQRGELSIPETGEFRAQMKSLEDLAAVQSQSVNLTGGERPERIRGAFVSANFFKVFNLAPLVGRTFLEGEDQTGGQKLVVISEKTWQERLNSDRDLSNKKLVLNGEPYSVIGVVSSSFKHPFDSDVEIWMPMFSYPGNTGQRESRFLFAIGHLKPAVDVSQAQAEATTVASQLSQTYPKENSGRGAKVEFYRDLIVSRIRPMLWLLFAAVGVILLIACANLANLLLARGLARQREISVRAALGAGRWRLIRQLLTETTLIGVLGGGAGLLLAYWGLFALLKLPQNFVGAADVSVDARVLLFAIAISVLTGWLFGLLPALHLAKPELHASLKEGSRGSIEGALWNRLRGGFVVVQVALSVLLLVGAGLLLRSFDQILRVDLGFKPERLLTLEYRLPRNKYGEVPNQWNFHRQVTEQLEQLPGVEKVALVRNLPFSGNGGSIGIILPDRDAPVPGTEPQVMFNTAMPGYFETIGIPLIKGRLFSAQDQANTPAVFLINQNMADKFWPNQEPLGRQIKIPERELTGTVIGIVGNAKHYQIEEDTTPQMYLAFSQNPGLFATVVMRTKVEPMSLTETVRQTIWKVDPDQPMWKIRTVEFLVNRSFANRQFLMALMGIFAALALVLTMIGLYGVITYLVNQRTREIGVRMALGAQVRDIMQMVLKQGMLLVLSGVALGIVGAWFLSRLISRLLYQVSATDPQTFAGVVLLLTVVALLACYLPARRAAKVDPLVALRHE